MSGQARQKVRPEAQRLSASVAAAADTFLGRPEEARYIRVFDSGFDALNGQCPTDVKPLRRGMKASSKAHFEALADLEAAMRLKLEGKTSLLPCQKGLIVTIKSMRGIVGSPRSPLSGCLYRDVTWGTESLAPFKYSGIWLNCTGA